MLFGSLGENCGHDEQTFAGLDENIRSNLGFMSFQMNLKVCRKSMLRGDCTDRILQDMICKTEERFGFHSEANGHTV